MQVMGLLDLRLKSRSNLRSIRKDERTTQDEENAKGTVDESIGLSEHRESQLGEESETGYREKESVEEEAKVNREECSVEKGLPRGRRDLASKRELIGERLGDSEASDSEVVEAIRLASRFRHR